MKKTLLLALVFKSLISFSQNNTCVVFSDTVGSGNYDQLILASYNPTTGNTNWPEALSFAWTCNAIGYPTCNYRTIFKYNLAAIPTNAVIVSAKFKLYAKTIDQVNGLPGQPMYGSNNTSLLSKVTSPWGLNNTGWLNQPSTTASGQKVLAQSTSSTQNYEIDVKDFVQSWVSTPSSNYGMLLKLQTEDYYNSMIFFGGTLSVPAQYRPALEVCYSVSNCQTITMKGTIGSGKFDQLILASYSASSGNANWQEALSFAWTCDAIGYPTCNYRTLFKYDLSSLPSNTTINSAKLKLFAKSTGQLNGYPNQPMYGGNNVSYLQKVTTSWNLNSTGWANQPSVNTSSQKTLAQSTSSTQNYEIDITDFVQAWVNKPDSNFGMLLRLKTESYYNSLIFHGGTTSVLEELRPTLEVCYDAGISLPVKLVDFNLEYKNNLARLYWKANNEQGTYNYEIQRSNDGIKFETISLVKAINQSNESSYQFVDNSLLEPNSKFYYRLIIHDADGLIRYSNILSLQIPARKFSFTASPNPAKSFIQIKYHVQKNERVMVKLIDLTGRVIKTYSNNLNAGTGKFILNELPAASGLYFLSIETETENQLIRISLIK